MMLWGSGLAFVAFWAVAICWRVFDMRREERKQRKVAVLSSMALSGQTDDSTEDAIRQFPGQPEPLVRWIEAAVKRQDYTEALKRADVLRGRFPDEPAGYALAAVALQHLGRGDEAEKLVEKGIGRVGNVSELRASQAHLALNSGDTDVAIERLANLRQAFPEERDGAIWGAEALARAGRHDEAEEVLAEFVEGKLQGNTDHSLVRYAEYAEARGNWDEAARRWTLMCDRLPLNASGHLGLLRSLRLAGRSAEAAIAATTAETLFPNDSAILAEISEARGHTVLGRAELEIPAAQSFPAVTDAAVPAPAIQLVPDAQARADAVDATATYLRAAEDALSNGDPVAAHALWTDIRARPDAVVQAWVCPADWFIEHGELEAAAALLADAAPRFPGLATACHDLARIAERRSEWRAAALAWRSFIAIESDKVWAYEALAACLRAEGAQDEADAALSAGMVSLPNEPALPIERARLAEAREDWHRALALWEEIARAWPTNAQAQAERIAALRRMGRGADADAALAAAAPHLSDRADLLHDAARLAVARKDWPAAEACWRGVEAAQPELWWTHAELSAALSHQGRGDAADAVLVAAQKRLPNEPNLLVSHARIALSRQDWPEAEHRANIGIVRFPEFWGVYRVKAEALAGSGRPDLADDFVRENSARFPTDPDALHDHARLCERQHDWSGAEAAWRAFIAVEPLPAWAHVGLANALSQQGRPDQALAVLDGAPADSASNAALADERARIVQAGEAPSAVASTEEAATLLMAFESLGGGGHGCEFGLLQRHYGAEPLGLLRWADIFQNELSQALETEFAGVGDAECTNVFVPEGDGRPEYWTTDTRYHMAMRCFVHVDEVPLERMTGQVLQRLKFLRTKLLGDLSAGGKLFVYKNMKRNLTPNEVDRLHAAIRRYGDNTLLYLRYQDEDHPNGTVRVAAPGLLVGYIDHFSHTPETDAYIGSANDSMLRLCVEAHRLWSADRASRVAPDAATLAALTNA